MKSNSPEAAKAEAMRELVKDLASFTHDPLGFVLWAFPWGVPGTDLEHETGPDMWQRAELEEIGESLDYDPHAIIKRATASGHGIGKSSEVSWLILWAMMTHEDTRGVVTANTATQLETKTWAELAKWHGMMVPQLRELFIHTATAIYNLSRPKQWRIDAIPNNPKKPAAFAGLHNAGKRILVVFDEASEIEDPIWDTTEGATTDLDTEIIWVTYGNPTRNTGRFRENIIGKFRHLWTARQIDSRTAKRTNKGLIAQWIESWGLDSDFVRTRVRGIFPRLGSMQLIPSDLVEAARRREPQYIVGEALVAGLDVARFGSNKSVLQPRQGRNARVLPRKVWRGIDTMTLASEVAIWCREYKPDALFVDVGGMGVGVYDRLIQLGIPNVFPVNFGDAGREVDWGGTRVKCANLRAAMWCSAREWLKLGCIPDEASLEEDLIGTQYGFNGNDDIQLESKEHMAGRGLESPDEGDALALTFAMPVVPKALQSAQDPRLIAASQPGGNALHGDYDLHRDLR